MSASKKEWLIGAGIVAILIALAGASVWFYIQSRPPKVDLTSQLRQLQMAAPTPLYAPTPLPPDFEVVADSVGFLEDGVASFSLLYKDKTVIVTEQPRPRLMEEVSKRVQFTTPEGNAYIADLNGRHSGFLVTTETLIIVSSPDRLGNDQLRQVIESLRRL